VALPRAAADRAYAPGQDGPDPFGAGSGPSRVEAWTDGPAKREHVMPTDPLTRTSSTDELHELAVERLEKRADFWPHLLAYVLVNLTLVVVWFLTSSDVIFWPLFPILGWGIGVAFHAWDVFRAPVSEARIQREMERLSGPSR
jgi:hypothetical protein